MSAGNANECDALFVYGTLKRGEAQHGMVGHAHRIARASLTGRLYALPYGYPALIRIDAGSDTVHGEVCFFSKDAIDRLLPHLDRYEGCDPDNPDGSLYLREIVEVRLADGSVASAWCYSMPESAEGRLRSQGKLVPDGRWSASTYGGMSG